MNKDTAAKQTISWQAWMDLLSLDEQESIAREVGLVDQNGNI